MNIHEAAASINGREYGQELTKVEEAAFKAAGLVVVFGASDDLLEFRGAIHDEVGAYEGTTVEIDRDGVREEWPERLVSEKWARAFFARERLPFAEIRAVWSDTDAPCWVIQTELPHATFEILEDGEPYFRGLVFSFTDLPPVVP